MNNKYLVVNCGSSSLKFSLYEMPNELELINGYIEKIGLEDSFYTIKINSNKISNKKSIKNHLEAVSIMIDELFNNEIIDEIDEIVGIGHRVLHGGEYYNDSVIINMEVIFNIESLIKLGPLHLPGELEGIKALIKSIPKAKQVAVFDTAFHQTIKEENYIYPVPYNWYLDYGVRKYGFHGTSHKYITMYMERLLKKDKLNLIICHVGSGASIACIKDSKSVNTTMGLTPLDGLIMGTRSGSIDPSIIKYVMQESDISIDELDNILNKNSGLVGICGKSDFRDVFSLKENNNELAILAYNKYIDTIVKYIGQYYFELNTNIDAIIFTAGVLENNPQIRRDIINKLRMPMDIVINEDNNNSIGYNLPYKEGVITEHSSKYPIYVIPTNEELMIVRDTYKLVNN